MANSNNKLTIGTIAANGLILIGAGHGGGPLMLLEMYLITNVPVALREMSFSMGGSYDSTTLTSCLFSILGSILLFLSVFNVSQSFRIVGIILLWTGFLYLTHGIVKNDGLSWFSFWCGTPFLVCSVILFIKTILSYKEPSAE